MKEKKDLIIYIVMVAILFGGGVGLGYYIWGINKQKIPDYKSYLKETIQYLGKIEEKNVILSKEAKSLKNDVVSLNKKVSEKQQELEKLSKSLETKITALKEKNAELGSIKNEKFLLEEEKVSLEKKVKEINDQINTCRREAEGIEKVSGGEEHENTGTQESEQDQIKGMKGGMGEEKTEIKKPEGHEENETLIKEQQQTEEKKVN